MTQLLLFRGGFLRVLKTGVGSRCEFVLEFLDPARGVHELQFPGVKRVTDIANVDFQLLAGASRFETVAATAGDLRFEVFRVDSVFHDQSLVG